MKHGRIIPPALLPTRQSCSSEVRQGITVFIHTLTSGFAAQTSRLGLHFRYGVHNWRKVHDHTRQILVTITCSNNIISCGLMKTRTNLPRWQVGHPYAHTHHQRQSPPNNDLLSLTCSFNCLLLTSFWLLVVAALCSWAFWFRQNWLHRIAEKTWPARSCWVISASYARDQQNWIYFKWGVHRLYDRCLLAALLTPSTASCQSSPTRTLEYLPALNARS